MSGVQIALILGGAECHTIDLLRAKEIIQLRPYHLFLINDQIEKHPERCEAACSLHPARMSVWLNTRRLLRENKAATDPPNWWNKPPQTWCHRKHPSREPWITNATEDWAGSGALFAAKVAFEIGYQKIILAGAPMDNSNHFVRKQPWNDCKAFRKAWKFRYSTYGKHVRSLSGWSAKQTGLATEVWLDEPPAFATDACDPPI